jgi:superfamily II DNA or RNA helicase
MITGLPPLREWQRTAHIQLKQLWASNTSAKALIAACPASGKTLLAAVLIYELIHEGEIDIAIILVPTVNIQLNWVNILNSVGVKSTSEASNANLKWRKRAGVPMAEDNKCLVLTYAQAAKDSELIAELARRAGRTFLGGDEIHHADDDEKYGEAVQEIADACCRTLALSGTPFNSTGGALTLCDAEVSVDSDTGQPIRKTLPTYSYSYGEALGGKDNVCRQVEFVKVYGKGESTYRLLSNNKLFKKITDLAKKRKSDRLNVLLDPNGEFMEECAQQAVRSLMELRTAGDRRAAMLVVAKDKAHGADMAKLLERVCQANNQTFTIQQIYNDTPKAHDLIVNLATGSTDIIVSVRMISEGVDIKRLRIGLFATDWMTQLFFIQFVGRFIRYEDRLDKAQFARVIIPAHIKLLQYALEIEKMIEAAALSQEGGEIGIIDKKSEFVDSTNNAGDIGVIHHAKQYEKTDTELAEAFFQRYPSARGQIPMALAIILAKESGLHGAVPDDMTPPKPDWSHKNDVLVRAIVRRLKNNSDLSDGDLYMKVQGVANRAVGIVKKDKMTAEDTLIKRHAFLHRWLIQLQTGQYEEDDVA